MKRVAVCFPTANPERTVTATAAWRAQGYEVRILVDGDAFPALDVDHLLRVPTYQGYFRAANDLTAAAVADGVDICVVAGDDMFPDPHHDAEELATEYFARFPDGFGIMQPTGDSMPCRAFAGSPWMGRGWVERMYEGRGPYWPQYWQSEGDVEIQQVAALLEVLWQRHELVQHHDHYLRQGSTVAATAYQQQNVSKWTKHDVGIFIARKAAGFPGAWEKPLDVPRRAASVARATTYHHNASNAVATDTPGWPATLNPRWGCLPLAAQPGALERVLHLAVPGTGEARALRSMASVYLAADRSVVRSADLLPAVRIAAEVIKPTLVFITLRNANAPLTGVDVSQLRACCDPSCVVINWDADAHLPPVPGSNWRDELGAACDASLSQTTEYTVTEFARGFCRPGYWPIGVNGRPGPAAPGVESVVLLADYKPTQRRLNAMVKMLVERRQDLGLYGSGWRKHGLQRYAEVRPSEVPGIYAAARATIIAANHNSLARHPGNRLLPALAHGAVCVVERFPDCEGLGLRDGINCLLWRGWDELQKCLTTALEMDEAARQAMRDAALRLAQLHTWEVRAQELQAIVHAVRADRG